jgi:hypothetical protein
MLTVVPRNLESTRVLLVHYRILLVLFGHIDLLRPSGKRSELNLLRHWLLRQTLLWSQ